MNSILLWLWRKLTAYVEGALDPESAARAKAFEARVAEAEAKEKEAEERARQSEVAYAASVERRKEFDRLIEESLKQEMASRERLAVSRARVKEIEDEAAKLKQQIDARPDKEKVRLDL